VPGMARTGSKPLSLVLLLQPNTTSQTTTPSSPSPKTVTTPKRTPPSTPTASPNLYCALCKKRFANEATLRTHEASAKHQSLLRASGASSNAKSPKTQQEPELSPMQHQARVDAMELMNKAKDADTDGKHTIALKHRYAALQRTAGAPPREKCHSPWNKR